MSKIKVSFYIHIYFVSSLLTFTSSALSVQVRKTTLGEKTIFLNALLETQCLFPSAQREDVL